MSGRTGGLLGSLWTRISFDKLDIRGASLLYELTCDGLNEQNERTLEGRGCIRVAWSPGGSFGGVQGQLRLWAV